MHGAHLFRGGPHGGPRHHHHHGPPPFGPWAGDVGFGRRRRMRRGDVRAALLVLLAEEPRNGYGLMQEIEQRSEGEWRPSPGSVYPALSQLEDEGLIRADQEGSGRRFALTDEGRAYVEEHRAELGEPWANLEAEGGSNRDLRRAIGETAAAVMQVARAGSPAQTQQALTILADARKALYRILADDE
jgi:DNA-binding PadR family transcriptional regulator